MLPSSVAAGREHQFQRQRGLVDEFHGHQRRLKHWHARLLGGRQKLLVRPELAAEHDAGNPEGKEVGVAGLALFMAQFAQVVNLRMAHDLQALVGEIAGEAAQGQTGPVDGRLADDALEIALFRSSFICERRGMFLEELLHGQGGAFHNN